MKYGATVLSMIVGFLIQSTLIQHMRIFGALPNIALILVVVFSVRQGMRIGICAALTAGILQDFFFSPAFGVYILIYLTVAVLVGSLSGSFFRESDATPIIMIAMASFCHYIILIGIYYFAGMKFDASAVVLRMILPETAYNAVVCWIVYRIYGRVLTRFGAESVGR